MHTLAHKSSTGDFFPTLDGIRGFAVLSVVIYHLAYFNPAFPIQNVLYSFTKAGFMGVPVFFVLSGFLISYTILKSQNRFNAKAYIARRAAKILPPFLISLVIFSFLTLLWKEPRNIWFSAVAYLLTLPNFISGWDGINPVYWSLLVEIHFYIVFPITYFLLKKASKFPELWCALIILIVPTILRLMNHMPLDTHTDTWFVNAQIFPRALDNFTLGIMFAHIFINRERYKAIIQNSSKLAWVGAIVLFISYCLCAGVNLFSPVHSPYSDPTRLWSFELFRFMPALGTFFLLFCIFSPQSSLINRVLMLKPLQYIGLISYEWFLFHYPPAQYLTYAFGQAGGSLSVYLSKTLLPFVVTFIFAAGIYHFVSSPIMSWAKKIKC